MKICAFLSFLIDVDGLILVNNGQCKKNVFLELLKLTHSMSLFPGKPCTQCSITQLLYIGQPQKKLTPNLFSALFKKRVISINLLNKKTIKNRIQIFFAAGKAIYVTRNPMCYSSNFALFHTHLNVTL